MGIFGNLNNTHAVEPIHAWFALAKQLQGVSISKDQGKTWKLHGAIHAPEWAFEGMTIELKDGRLWMLIRAGEGSFGRVSRKIAVSRGAKGVQRRLQVPVRDSFCGVLHPISL